MHVRPQCPQCLLLQTALLLPQLLLSSQQILQVCVLLLFLLYLIPKLSEINLHRRDLSPHLNLLECDLSNQSLEHLAPLLELLNRLVCKPLPRILHFYLVNHVISLHLGQPLEMPLDFLHLGVSLVCNSFRFSSDKGVQVSLELREVERIEV